MLLLIVKEEREGETSNSAGALSFYPATQGKNQSLKRVQPNRNGGLDQSSVGNSIYKI